MVRRNSSRECRLRRDYGDFDPGSLDLGLAIARLQEEETTVDESLKPPSASQSTTAPASFDEAAWDEFIDAVFSRQDAIAQAGGIDMGDASLRCVSSDAFTDLNCHLVGPTGALGSTMGCKFVRMSPDPILQGSILSARVVSSDVEGHFDVVLNVNTDVVNAHAKAMQCQASR